MFVYLYYWLDGRIPIIPIFHYLCYFRLKSFKQANIPISVLYLLKKELCSENVLEF